MDSNKRGTATEQNTVDLEATWSIGIDDKNTRALGIGASVETVPAEIDTCDEYTQTVEMLEEAEETDVCIPQVNNQSANNMGFQKKISKAALKYMDHIINETEAADSEDFEKRRTKKKFEIMEYIPTAIIILSVITMLVVTGVFLYREKANSQYYLPQESIISGYSNNP